MKCIVIVPVFNEGLRAVATIKKILKSTNNPIIVVDDGSEDGTPELLRKEFGRQKRVELLFHILNLGKGAAVKTGVEEAWQAGAEGVIVIDSDGQHDPKFLKVFEKNLLRHQIVFGYRDMDKQVPWVRRFGNLGASRLMQILFNIRKKDLLSGYMAFRKEVYPKIYWHSRRYGLETEMAAKIGRKGLKFKEIKIDTIYMDKYKGVSILDVVSILFQLPIWFIEE